MEKAQVITDAELLSEYAKKFTEEPAPVIETQAPSASSLTLLAGVEINNELVTEVEIRELNGADEEAIAKAGSLGKSLSTILQRGVVKFGDTPATVELLDRLVSGDRDLIMLAICRLTFGNTVESDITCQKCESNVHVSIDLLSDVPMRAFDGEWSWEIPTGLGLVKVTLPDGATQKRLMDSAGATTAELSTVLLSGCILSVDGLPVVPSRVALELGIKDREKILQKILEATPGPRLLEVSTACEACGNKIYTPLSLASLFRL